MATASKAAPKAAAPAEDAAPKKSNKTLFIIAGAAVVLAAAGGGAWMFMNKGGQEHGDAKHAKAEPAKPPAFMSLETFTVNLQAEEAQQQFLQVNITLQTSEHDQDAIKLHMPQVRNRLLLLLSSKKPSEILTVEGKKKLASEIIETMKQPFTPQGPAQEIQDVFFTSFVVQ